MSARASGGRRRRAGLPVNAEINVTNLVDVAFVLLIIFVITAPILQGGVEIDLPRAEAAPVTTGEGVIVTVARDGRIYVGEVAVRSLDEFERVYRQVMAARGAKEAYLRGDAAVPYGRVLEVIGRMRRIDVGSVALIAEPVVEERR